MSTITPHPLCWPAGWPRTAAADRLPYLKGTAQKWDRLLERLNHEMRLLHHTRHFTLSTDRPLRQDGLPYAQASINEDPGAAIYFTRREKQLVIAQDRYANLNDNVRSLVLAIEGLRQLERHGGDTIMDYAYQGFEALPAPDAWWLVLGVDRECTLESAEKRYRRLSRVEHPDAGGSGARQADLNKAIADARAAHGQ